MRSEWVRQGRSQGRVPGVPEPPFWVMKMNIISRGKMCRNPPLEIPRDEIFVFEEEQKKIKEHHYGRKIDISATIDLFARKHPRRLLLSDILAEWTVDVNHNFIQHLMKYVIC